MPLMNEFYEFIFSEYVYSNKHISFHDSGNNTASNNQVPIYS